MVYFPGFFNLVCKRSLEESKHKAGICLCMEVDSMVYVLFIMLHAH